MITKMDADKAVELLLAQDAETKTETVALWDIEDRVLAEDIYTRISVPPFDRSPYDGYALISADTANATRENPVTLKITEELPAGKAPTIPLTHGYAAKILTGAPIPDGADTTVKYEITEFSDTEVRIFEPCKPDSDVVHAGEDVKAGELIAKAGTYITAALQGMIAGQGFAEVKVYKKPVITVISTGTELAEAGQKLESAQIYNSNVYTISSFLRDAGAEPKNGGIAVDDLDVIMHKISAAMEESDMVVTTGGASVGDYDWAERAARSLGANVLFWKVNMKPGGAIVAAMCGPKLLLSLSGNPGAAVIGLLRIGMPYIKRLCGRTDYIKPPETAVMKNTFKKKSPQRRFLRGHLEIDGGTAYFVSNDGQSNGSVSSFVNCDMLAEINAGSGAVAAGEKVKVYRVGRGL